MNSDLTKLIGKYPSEPLYKIIYRYLYNEIILFSFLPNEKLNISQLAASLEVSTTPVSNAISLLVSDGLVAKNEKGQIVVCSPDTYDMFNVCEARQVIETQAAILLCSCYNNKIAASLKALNAEFIAALRRRDFKRTVENDKRFHRYIVSRTPNPLLLPMYDAINKEVSRYLSYCAYRLTDESCSSAVIETCVNHHNMIVSAFDSRIPANVESAMKRHLSYGAIKLLPNPIL